MSCEANFFCFNDTATTEIYTLSLHDALPISIPDRLTTLPKAPDFVEGIMNLRGKVLPVIDQRRRFEAAPCRDRKSTRLNSSHANISYAVFCLKKKQEPASPTCCSRPPPPSSL